MKIREFVEEAKKNNTVCKKIVKTKLKNKEMK